MYFALYESQGKWYPMMLHHKIKFWTTLDGEEGVYKDIRQDDPKIKVFSLNHTVDQHLKIANRVAELTNMVDAVIDKGEQLHVI